MSFKTGLMARFFSLAASSASERHRGGEHLDTLNAPAQYAVS
jgi:hypothetical protein